MMDALEETKRVFTIAEDVENIYDELTDCVENPPHPSDSYYENLDDISSQNCNTTSFKVMDNTIKRIPHVRSELCVPTENDKGKCENFFRLKKYWPLFVFIAVILIASFIVMLMMLYEIPFNSYASKRGPLNSIPTNIPTTEGLSKTKCSKTSSSNLFQPIKRLNNLDIQREIRTKENIIILHDVTYDLKNVEKHLLFKKYNTCVINLTSREKKAHYEIEYEVSETVFYFNRSDSHPDTIYRDIPMIYIDCRNKISLSPERISFQLPRSNFLPTANALQHYKRNFKTSKVLESFLKYAEAVYIPRMKMTFSFIGEILTFQNGLLQEKQKETGQVFVGMSLENNKKMSTTTYQRYQKCN